MRSRAAGGSMGLVVRRHQRLIEKDSVVPPVNEDPVGGPSAPDQVAAELVCVEDPPVHVLALQEGGGPFGEIVGSHAESSRVPRCQEGLIHDGGGRAQAGRRGPRSAPAPGRTARGTGRAGRRPRGRGRAPGAGARRGRSTGRPDCGRRRSFPCTGRSPSPPGRRRPSQAKSSRAVMRKARSTTPEPQSPPTRRGRSRGGPTPRPIPQRSPALSWCSAGAGRGAWRRRGDSARAARGRQATAVARCRRRGRSRERRPQPGAARAPGSRFASRTRPGRAKPKTKLACTLVQMSCTGRSA